jgi:hypothetical protein
MEGETGGKDSMRCVLLHPLGRFASAASEAVGNLALPRFSKREYFY